MNPEIEAMLLKFEEYEKLPPITQQQWVKWQSDIEKGVTISTIRYCNYVGDEESERKKDRKVVAVFHPKDLGISDGAIDKMIQIVGQRYNKRTGLIKIVSRVMPTKASNNRRINIQIGQLIYHSSVLAGDIVPEASPAEDVPPPAEEAPAMAAAAQ